MIEYETLACAFVALVILYVLLGGDDNKGGMV